jgi:probable rRNA maturation factor
MSVEVCNESGVAADELRLVSLSRYVLDALRIHPLAELSLRLVDIDEMTNLHVRFMDEPGPTDVLSFPMDELRPGRPDAPYADDDEMPSMLGDVVLCPEVAAKQGREAGHSTQEELEMLCTHGILHLLGFDHAEPDEHREMFGLQSRLLRDWRASASSGQRREAHKREGAHDA